MKLIRIKYGTPEHKKEISLRHEVLRAPLGLRFRDEDLRAEVNELRYGFLDETGDIVACLLGRKLDNGVIKLRQMAVKEVLRGRGIGKDLMIAVEDDLKKNGFTSLELHARIVARGFYEKLGYAPAGGVFTEIGIPHIKMVKEI
jgi:predicted GNAT family N-acyltransferase